MSLQVCVSDRCFFPNSAFLASRKIVTLAKSFGYKAVEFHPTWSVWWEIMRYGSLRCRNNDICSFHIDWRQDRVKEGSALLERTACLYSYLFPPIGISLKIIQQLEAKYQKEVVVHWENNIAEYQQPIMELQNFLNLNLNQVLDRVREGKLKGLVIDTNKLGGWMKRHNLDTDFMSLLKKIIRYTSEVHFRFKEQADIDSIFGSQPTVSIRIMKMLIRLGYRGRVVVESGWPDAGAVGSLWRIDLVKAKKLHLQIVKYLKNI